MAEQIINKTCPRCNQRKPIQQFHKKSSKKDGCQAYCKICTKEYFKNPKIKIAAQKAKKKYNQTVKHKISQNRYNKSEKGKESMKRFLANHPNFWKARNALISAKIIGKLPRANTMPCYYCGNPAKEYHHWHGYEPKHWLDVIPVCNKCHNNIHKSKNV